MYNNEIHIMGTGYSSSLYTRHYKYNSTSLWTYTTILPYNFYFGSAVVYNNDIHILGGNATSPFTQHYNITSKKTVIPYFAKK